MNSTYAFVTLDVFAAQRFGGNPLAVVLDATGLTSEQMQHIAREFNYSETTFVLPPEQGGDYRVRIFTTTTELPFAGHPTIGTAIVLANEGRLPANNLLHFEQPAGLVPVLLTGSAANGWQAQLTAPAPLHCGQCFSPALLAELLSLSEASILTNRHAPQLCSVGLPFLLVELASVAALRKARINMAVVPQLQGQMENCFIHLYVRSGDEFDIRCRMFAPGEGIVEDPATGSANCALAGLLASLEAEPTATLQYHIAQGVEMGRPSELCATVDKRDGVIDRVKLAGRAVEFSRGQLSI